MGEEEYQRVKNSCFLYHGDERYKDQVMVKNVEVLEEEDDASSSISSINSTISNGSSSSSDMVDDASSSSNSCSSSLYDLSEIMSQLPIKKGLSKFYQGKSESFTSLSRVTSIEDLAKKQTPYRKNKINSSKSYGGGLGNYKLYTLPKSGISKKYKSRGSVISSSYNHSSRRGSFVISGSPPLIPSQKLNFD